MSEQGELNFHNTTDLSGEKLSKEILNAKNQQGRVLRVFSKRECELLTPCDIMSILLQQGHSDLLTSVRRSMSNLTEMGFLEKTKHTKKGLYGKKVFCWRFSGD